MRKATHYGICQVCGHRQKLPGGCLSKHGYTKRWGFFEGECQGTGHLPFEKSIDLIAHAIAMAQERSKQLNAEADKRDAVIDANDVVYNAYEADWSRLGQRWLGRGYARIPGRVEMRKFENSLHSYQQPWFVARDFKYEHRLGPGVLQNAVKELNSSESWRLRELAKQADQYVAWQQARIKDWKPSELEPVEAK